MERTLLLCDADTQLATIYGEALKGDRIQVFGCGDPHKLPALALSAQPDMILISVEPDQTDAIQVCRQLKRHPQTLAVPVLMLADAPDHHARRKAIRAGAMDLLPRISSHFFVRERILACLNESERFALASRMTERSFQVLIAEDSPSLQQFYSAVLQELNCAVVQCDNGRDAWHQLKSNGEFDLVITDLFMPVMDGRELCNLIRSHHEFDQIPLLVITTEQEKPVLYDLLDMGVNDFIQKPHFSFILFLIFR